MVSPRVSLRIEINAENFIEEEESNLLLCQYEECIKVKSNLCHKAQLNYIVSTDIVTQNLKPSNAPFLRNFFP